MKELFVEREFSGENMEMIVTINSILDEYQRAGYRLTLRQLYYQLVSRDYIPNTQRSYKNIGNLISNARQAGAIDWDMIEDRNRETTIPTHWRNPAHIVSAAAQQFKIDKWVRQPYHIEVMVEKDALSGVLEPVCSRLDIGITANKGYCSSSTMYEIGKRLMHKHCESDKRIVVLYLGDHDPSGIDMTRDVEERLRLYSTTDEIEVVRLALNWEQIEEWKPPENPAKQTDARFKTYSRRYGDSSWELDAVEPAQLGRLVEGFVSGYVDSMIWEEDVRHELEMREELNRFVETYNAG